MKSLNNCLILKVVLCLFMSSASAGTESNNDGSILPVLQQATFPAVEGMEFPAVPEQSVVDTNSIGVVDTIISEAVGQQQCLPGMQCYPGTASVIPLARRIVQAPFVAAGHIVSPFSSPASVLTGVSGGPCSSGCPCASQGVACSPNCPCVPQTTQYNVQSVMQFAPAPTYTYSYGEPETARQGGLFGGRGPIRNLLFGGGRILRGGGGCGK